MCGVDMLRVILDIGVVEWKEGGGMCRGMRNNIETVR